MDTTRHLEKAEEALRRRNFDFAIALYRQLLGIRPDDGAARRGLWKAIRLRREHRPASRWIGRLSGAAPRLLGAICAAAKRHATAAHLFESAYAQDPDDARLGHRAALALERAGFSDSALAAYETLAEADASDGEACKRAGALLYRKREVERAIEYYERAIRVDPRDSEALKARKDLAAEGALARGGFDEKKSSRERIATREDVREAARGHRVLQSREEKEEEIERLREKHRRSPSDPLAGEALGKALSKAGRFEEAISVLEEAFALAPDAYELRVALGDARIAQASAQVERARASMDGTAVDAAERALREVEVAEVAGRVGAHPTDMGLRVRYARLLEGGGRLDEALAELQRAVSDPRQRTEALLGMGRCFEGKGLGDLARKQFERALEAVGSTDPRSKEILYSLGSLCEKMGAREDARAYYARIYELDVTFRDVSRKMESLKAS
jgi:tetratricopeptide (TPR) repeat protein